MMNTIGSYEVKTHLAEILKKVVQGKEFLITKHGMPIAKIIPYKNDNKENPQMVIEEIKKFREGKKLGHLNIKNLIEEGRRF